MKPMRFFLWGLLLAGFCSAAGAEAAERPLWEAGAGVAILQMPDYRGSDERRWMVLPYPYLVYRGDVLRVERERVSGRLFRTDRVLLDFSLSGSLPVESGKNDARAGMPDLDPTFEVGPSLNIRLWEGGDRHFRLSLFLPLRAVFSTDFSSVRKEGWVFHPRMVLEKPDLIPRSGIDLGFAAGPIFADRDYHRYFYEVGPAYATTARPFYEAGGGYSGTAITLGLNKRFSQVIVHSFVGCDFLKGAAFTDSPLVKDQISVMAGITFSWLFWTSQRQVSSER